MEVFNDTRNALKELEAQIGKLDKLITDKEKEYQGLMKKTEEEKKLCNEIIYEKGNLEEILNQCSVDVCQYKNEFKSIKKAYSAKLEDSITDKIFHFFLCHRGDYYSTAGIGVIESHKEIIEKNGFCWWGKFIKERGKGGQYYSLEPFGESIMPDGSGSVAFEIRGQVGERIKEGENVYLYNYSPNPPDIKFFVCNIIDVFYGEEKIPYQDDDYPPQCAYVPTYYFHRHEGNCIACKNINQARCQLRFLCNFWFKIDRIKELDDVEDEFTNLINCFTDDSINFAIPILYPLLVTQRNIRYHFPEIVEPLRQKAVFRMHIPKSEKGHTKMEKVKSFFSYLNEKCHETFVSVESIDCQRHYSGMPQLQQSKEDDEILLYLPSEYRSDGKAMRFKICLDKRTKAEQKQKVEEMIRSCLEHK